MRHITQDSEIALKRVGVQVQVPGQDRRRVLEDVSFSWSSGQSIGLVGPSGSGKTTLLRLLAGLERPSSGVIRRRKSIRVMAVLQRPEDHFSETLVGEQVASYAPGVLLPSGRAEALASVGLRKEALSWPLRELSSGHQRLVAIACALVTEAPFLALDEPMAGLDAVGRGLVSTALQQIVEDRRAALLIVSHHLDDLLELVDRLLILDQGRLSYDGTLATVPLGALARCIADPAQSLYYTLRRLDAAGMRLNGKTCAKRDPSLLARRLLAAQSSE